MALTAPLLTALSTSIVQTATAVLTGASGDGAPSDPAATAPHALDGSEELVLALRAGAGVGVALVVAIVIGVVVRRAGRKSPLVTDLSRRVRRPLRLLLVVFTLRQVAVSSPGTDNWLDVTEFLLTAALIGSAAWLLSTIAFVGEDVVLRNYRVDVADNRHNRRVRTQVSFMRRLVVALVILVAVAAMLLTIPEVRAVGTGILASAGLISVVAGLAAQSALTNVFAGIQLAFTDAIRVDDVVVVETQFGKVEEITMTYVVVRLWDDRRLVLPSTYFTTTPFENWTRSESKLLGTVLVEVDWRTDFDAMRTEMRRALEADDLWDGRVGVLQVTDAVGSVVQVRVLVSAADAPSVFDLRCHVREALVRWLVARDPAGLPRQRVENSGEPAPGEQPARPADPSTWDLPAVRPAELHAAHTPGDADHPASPPSGWDVPAVSPGPLRAVAEGPRVAVGGEGERNDSLFTGSTAAVQRSRDFSGPSEGDRRARAAVDDGSETRQVAAPAEEETDPDATTVLPQVPPRQP